MFLGVAKRLLLLGKTILIFFNGDFVVASSVEDGALRFDEEMEVLIGALVVSLGV